MSRGSKLLLFSLTVVALVGCSKDSDGASGNAPRVEKDEYCFPESELMNPAGIVGGTRVTSYSADAKRVVLLYFAGQDGKTKICTAAPIAPDVLLTAAHCIGASAEKTLVLTHVGMSCESGFDVRYNSQKASEILKNENYVAISRFQDSKADVGLIFLKEKLPYGYPVYKIADPKDLTEQSELYFFGYGAIGEGKGGSGLLRKATLPRLDFKILENQNKVQVDQTHGMGVCHGDSGGPGLVLINGEYQILGVNSYVDPVTSSNPDMCQGDGYLELASYYKSWIEQKMQARGRSLRN